MGIFLTFSSETKIMKIRHSEVENLSQKLITLRIEKKKEGGTIFFHFYSIIRGEL